MRLERDVRRVHLVRSSMSTSMASCSTCSSSLSSSNCTSSSLKPAARHDKMLNSSSCHLAPVKRWVCCARLMYTLWIWECRSFVMTCSCPRLMSLMSPRLRFLFIKPSLMWGMCGSCVCKTQTGSHRSVQVAQCPLLSWTQNPNVFVRVSVMKLGRWHKCRLGLTRIIKLMLPASHRLLGTCLPGSLLVVLSSFFFRFCVLQTNNKNNKGIRNCNVKVENCRMQPHEYTNKG